MKPLVLLIEDNEHNRYLLSFLLQQHGYSVVTAVDGDQGVELAAQRLPKLILLDIQLPRRDGYSVARELRENEHLRGVPIIAVTSHALVGDREKSLAAGCTGYIEKPINPETFIAEIECFLAIDSNWNQTS